MRRLISCVGGLLALAMAQGCSEGSAATFQKTPTKAVDYASLEPRSGNIPINPVRIPEARKNPASSIARDAKPNIVQPISVGQDKNADDANRGNNKGDRAGRGGQGRGGFNR